MSQFCDVIQDISVPLPNSRNIVDKMIKNVLSFRYFMSSVLTQQWIMCIL